MKKVFETKDKVEAECLAGKLEDECLETKLEQNAGKYELYVDENVYDEALLQIENLEYDLPKIVSQNKAKSNNTSSEYEKDSFLYAVEKFFQLKFWNVLLISVLFALFCDFVFVLPRAIFIMKGIEIIVVLVFLFICTFFISLLIMIPTRYYQIWRQTTVFSIRKKKDYSGIEYKEFFFVLATILHIAWCGFSIFLVGWLFNG